MRLLRSAANSSRILHSHHPGSTSSSLAPLLAAYRLDRAYQRAVFSSLKSTSPPHYSTMSSAGANKPRAGPLPNDAKSGPKGEAMTPIPSASLIVLCPPASTSKSSEGKSTSSDGGSAGGSSGLATLMLQRSARMGSSFRSAVVFPGGALDLADQDAVTEASGTESAPEGEAARMAALQICSLRETFEETGLLLLPSERASKEQGGEEIPWSRAVGHREAGLSVEEWREWREKVSMPDTTGERDEF